MSTHFRLKTAIAALFVSGAAITGTYAKAPAPITVSGDAIGGLTSKTVADKASLEKAFPGYDIYEETRMAEGIPMPVFTVLDGEKLLLTIYPVDMGDGKPRIYSVHIETPLIRTAEGLSVGHRYEDVYGANNADCAPGIDERSGQALCSAPEADNLRLAFGGTWNGPDSEVAPLEVLKDWTIYSMFWLPTHTE